MQTTDPVRLGRKKAAAAGLVTLAIAPVSLVVALTGPVASVRDGASPSTATAGAKVGTDGVATPDGMAAADTALRDRRGCARRPSACGYPDWSNTGVPDGVRLRSSGPITADRNGQVIDGLDIRQEVNVVASNVTIKNSRITATGGDWVVIVRPGAENLTIKDSELRTPSGTPQDMACVLNIGDTSPTLLRLNLHGCSAGVSSGGGLVQDSYIHGMSQLPGLSHVVGVASNGGGGLTVRHNTILNKYSQTAAVAFYQDFGGQANNLVVNNLLAGGGYCVYGGQGPRETRNIRFINNRFSRLYFRNCGFYGVSATFDRFAPGNEWRGNYWDEDGKTVGG